MTTVTIFDGLDSGGSSILNAFSMASHLGGWSLVFGSVASLAIESFLQNGYGSTFIFQGLDRRIALSSVAESLHVHGHLTLNESRLMVHNVSEILVLYQPVPPPARCTLRSSDCSLVDIRDQEKGLTEILERACLAVFKS